jgi:hypothetical protein
MLKIIRAVVLLLLIGIGARINAEMTVKDYRNAFKEKADPVTRKMAEAYFLGVGRGFSWANGKLAVTNRPPLYCEPDKMPQMNLGNYQDLVDGRISRLAKTVTKQELEQRLVEVLLLDALQEAFPCTEQKCGADCRITPR